MVAWLLAGSAGLQTIGAISSADAAQKTNSINYMQTQIAYAEQQRQAELATQKELATLRTIAGAYGGGGSQYGLLGSGRSRALINLRRYNDNVDTSLSLANISRKLTRSNIKRKLTGELVKTSLNLGLGLSEYAPKSDAGQFINKYL